MMACAIYSEQGFLTTLVEFKAQKDDFLIN